MPRSFVFFSASGCLVPALMILNLLVGWLFLKPMHWLATEAILAAIFIIQGSIFTRKIISASSGKREDVIDVKGEVVRERRHLK